MGLLPGTRIAVILDRALHRAIRHMRMDRSISSDLFHAGSELLFLNYVPGSSTFILGILCSCSFIVVLQPKQELTRNRPGKIKQIKEKRRWREKENYSKPW